MKKPQSFAEAFSPGSVKTTHKEKEKFEMVSLQVFPNLALDKEYEGYDIKHLLKPIYTNTNHVETNNSLKTRRYFEFILVDTGSVEIEHELAHKSDPESIAYSKFTIKNILSPLNWHVNHLPTLINLSKRFNPQTYNWYDYKNAWINFLYVRPTTHTWFMKYCLEVVASTIPR